MEGNAEIENGAGLHAIGCIYRDGVDRATHPPLSICSGEKGWGGESRSQGIRVNMAHWNETLRSFQSLLVRFLLYSAD